jgi:GNAT superfamily N-acetyltransferase
MLGIRHYKQISNTSALPLALRAQQALRNNGFVDNLLTLSWDHSAIEAVPDLTGRGIGIMVYQHLEWAKQIYVGIGWVDPNYRRQGVYTHMWRALLAKAKDLKVVEIRGITHVDNGSMRTLAAKLGRVEMAVVTNFRVPGGDASDAEEIFADVEVVCRPGGSIT